ncbi:deaminase [bacterium]|nr:deaminase [bacterium]|tara:strand:- start:2530 stop:2940 length:411 start_codon:yes stop_codon:yes gene_type:complete
MKQKFKEAFMDCAERFAQLSSAKRAQVGAIIVKDNRIISIGYNGMPSGWSNECEDDNKTKPEVLHAETNAIAKVAQSSESCKDAILFCTHEPCLECAKLIHQSGIGAVFYKHKYISNNHGTGLEFLESSGIRTELV